MNKRTQEECKALIDETVEYYKNNPKGLAKNLINGHISCTYYDPVTGNMCAVGRCLDEPQKFSDTSSCATVLIKKKGDIIFKDQYRNFPILLWEELQGLHDCEIYWDGKELSERGKKELFKMKENEWI